MSMTVPGKILVIENKWEDVRKTVKSFWKAGEGIVYSSEIPEENKCPSNVRLVILDLVLHEDGEIQDSDYEQAALAIIRIEKRTSFFLVAPWSVHIRSDNKAEVMRNIQEAYKAQTGKELQERILKAFGKKEITQERLVSEIGKWIRRNPEAGLVFEWEKSIEDGRDRTASEIINTGGISTVVKSVEKEVGRHATPRETFTLFNKLLLRHSLASLGGGKFIPLLRKILSGEEPREMDILARYPKIRYLETYYKVEDKEPLWTGDIFRTGLNDPQKKYVVVINPTCDFAQKKVTKIKVVFGTEIKTVRNYQVSDTYVPLIVRKFGRTKKGKWKKRNEVINAIATGSGLPQRYYILHFLRSSVDADDYFHLLIDFSMVQSEAKKGGEGAVKIPSRWHRICRLDSPYIEDLLQKYASISARIGTPDIPENVIKKEKERLTSTG